MTETHPSQVLIAGGGVAALEALMALRDLAGDRVDITLIAPETTFTYRPMKVAEPFYKGHAHEYGLVEIARDHGARFVRDSIAEVHADEKVVRCASGAHIPYDQLVLATGAKAVPAFRDALTFGEDPAERKLHGLLADLEQGYVHSVAFVVPGEAAWTLPLYEIALMTARQTWGMGMDGVRFTLVTPEERPLAMFGEPASEAVAQMLSDEGIEFVGSSYPTVGRGYVIADPGGRRIDVDRVVSLPVLDGLRLAGVPADARRIHPRRRPRARARPAGRLRRGRRHQLPDQAGRPRDAAGRRRGAGDRGRGRRATSSPSRSARSCAACFSPAATTATCATPSPAAGARARSSGRTLWWPPTKIAGQYLSGYLFDRDDAQTVEEIRSRSPRRSRSRSTRMPPPGTPSAAHGLAASEVCDALGVDARTGLSEAGGRDGASPSEGPNELRREAPPSRLALVARQFVNSMVLLLVGAAVISLAIGELLDAAVILAIVVANAVFGAVQEGRADKAAAAVRALLAPTAHLLRGGHVSERPAAEVVVGDVVALGAGDRVPGGRAAGRGHAPAGRRVRAHRRVARDQQARRPARSGGRAARRAPHRRCSPAPPSPAGPGASSSPRPAPRPRWAGSPVPPGAPRPARRCRLGWTVFRGC